MVNINEILARAAALRDETALNSISPERAGSIMYDTLIALNELWLQQGAALVISKIYASVAAMEADTSPVSDFTGLPLRPGQIVVIASSDADNGSVYRYDGAETPSWSRVGKIGNLDPVDNLESDSTSLPLAAHQGKVLDGKMQQMAAAIGSSIPRGIYSSMPVNHLPVSQFIDLSIENPQPGKLYWLEIYKDGGWQQLTMFRTTAADPTGYEAYVHFKDVYEHHTGLHKYTVIMEEGDNETFTIVFNWDLITIEERRLYDYHPDKYFFNDAVFSGGLVYNKLMQTDTTLERPGVPADAKAVGDIVFPLILPTDKYWAACGDSITNANHGNIYDVQDDDPYCPIDGYPDAWLTYKRKCYAYYVAKKNNLQWANYGFGGTTLHHCDPKAYRGEQYFFPFVDERMTQMKAGVDWDYISIFFGWNDCAFGPVYQRDLWLQETYGGDIGYPDKPEQIGAPGFATQAQKDACDAATGTVGGVFYDNADDYFFARFIGTIDDTVKTTWMGAWNNALEYLMRKYTKAKILVVAPFVFSHKQIVRDSVKAIASKWGVSCFDFEDLPYWYYKTDENNTPFAPESGNWVTENGDICGNTVEGYNQARLSYDTLHPSNLGYETIAGPIGDKLLNG